MAGVLVHNECGSNGTYKKASYHNKGNAKKSAAPVDGQKALDNSIQVSNNSPRRIGVSQGEFVVLDQTSPGVYHGHVRSWNQLETGMKNALVKGGLANRHGKILID